MKEHLEDLQAKKEREDEISIALDQLSHTSSVTNQWNKCCHNVPQYLMRKNQYTKDAPLQGANIKK